MFAIATTFLGLVALSLSDPRPCEDLAMALDPVDPQQFQGIWALVASGMQEPSGAETLKKRDSITVNVTGTSYTQAIRHGNQCMYRHQDLKMEGNVFSTQVLEWKFSGTLLKSSCTDCMVVKFEGVSASQRFLDLYLFSRRREVTQEEMDEFKAQVNCLNIPEPVLMDPTKDLCPDPSDLLSQAAEE